MRSENERLEKRIEGSLNRLLSFIPMSPAPQLIHDRIDAMPLKKKAEFEPHIRNLLDGTEPVEIYLEQPFGPLALYLTYRQHGDTTPGEPPIRTEAFLRAHYLNGKPIDVKYDKRERMFLPSGQQSVPFDPARYVPRLFHRHTGGRLFRFAREKDPNQYCIAVATMAAEPSTTVAGTGRKVLYSQFRLGPE